MSSVGYGTLLNDSNDSSVSMSFVVYFRTMLDPLMRDTEVAKLHDWNIHPKPKQICESKIEDMQKKKKKLRGLAPITWTVSDLAKAGCLLTNPPQHTSFEDEQEMRRVYTLIYDVFRYKNVLNQALNDVSFFQIFPTLVHTVPQVWLLFYDLYHRSFKKRETKVAPLAGKLFDSVGMTYAENALWTQKVKLAAAVARLRIKHNALCLSELLPPHLKDEKVTEQAQNNPVTCWVNSVKVRDLNILCKDLEQTFSLKMVNDVKKIGKNSFKWDRHCPLIMAFHASMRPKLARSPFVRDHVLIVQGTYDNAKLKYSNFIFLKSGQITNHLKVSCRVFLTTSAMFYTGSLSIRPIARFQPNSTGNHRKPEYEKYFTELGMTNISIYSDRLIDTPADANYMEEVVAVFATPPNSYSAVIDPIDLVI
ncbi:hypothetical protein NQ314_015296 [Rhamnusium bicolor]|uniref:Uncharacterized protein n=1 Tax=Rhamnusium bicolor TaxID=1586634 RepID=A0AAV8WYI4_9CUCU|nr:hypothetical protein NQ314_015296 [Rhamnusium bicolor]